ncbi:TetR/AcrR family transcriptional regulator [Insolitispirillum peregrinum]|uniref:Transcriptional regulator, TetR family n=1 Tax=Insolitispirillum peregrinum TaxID=80876 RepID=A0A1N7LA33_9PROT|nr:CerR family C-terminal domain-containing protein [Insolitispirillum peregrinum]SIS70706.1 transcriptional regulator, TetR family [Insolitispirillum peregrinum]
MARPGRREDGAATRQTILDAAGEVFAAKGFGQATGKEIAERAGTNSAAVNYYFGGIDGLYAEVLIEAHHRLLDYDLLKAMADAPGDPRQKLAQLLAGVFPAVLTPAASPWPLRVLGREMVTPSTAFPTLLEREILPKKQLMIGLVAAILGVPADHPAVPRCALAIMAPIALLVLAGPNVRAQLVPPAGFDDPAAVARHFQTFIAAGMAAVAADLAQDKDSIKTAGENRMEP